MVVCFVVPGSFAFAPPSAVHARRASARHRAQGAALLALGVTLTVTSVYACVTEILSRGATGGDD